MKEVTLVRYSEIGLKGKNRNWYERKLIEQIEQRARANAIQIEVKKKFGRILVYSKEPLHFLKYIFGIKSYSPALEVKVDIKKMGDAVMVLSELHSNVSFRVSCQRLDKTIEIKSPELSKQLGAEIVERTNAEVDLTEYDINVTVELIDKKAYVYTDKIKCFGGLPIGTQGKVVALIENKKDELAAVLMLKRGCTVVPTSEVSEWLRKYGILAKRSIEESEAEAIITGQTLETIKPIETKKLVLRPLCGMNEKEIEDKINEFMHH